MGQPRDIPQPNRKLRIDLQKPLFKLVGIETEPLAVLARERQLQHMHRPTGSKRLHIDQGDELFEILGLDRIIEPARKLGSAKHRRIGFGLSKRSDPVPFGGGNRKPPMGLEQVNLVADRNADAPESDCRVLGRTGDARYGQDHRIDPLGETHLRKDSRALPCITPSKHQGLPRQLAVDRSLITRRHIRIDHQAFDLLWISLEGDVANGPIKKLQCRLEPRPFRGRQVALPRSEPIAKKSIAKRFVDNPARDLLEHLTLHHVLALGLAKL